MARRSRSEIIRSNKQFNTSMLRSAWALQPCASTIHSVPFIDCLVCYCWACPHSEQNLLILGIGLPQFKQNFVSAPAAVTPELVAPDSGPEDPALFNASIIAWPMATPAPSPAPTPAAPPPSFAAAMGMDCATW